MLRPAVILCRLAIFVTLTVGMPINHGNPQGDTSSLEGEAINVKRSLEDPAVRVKRSDDLSLTEIQALLLQQTQTFQTLQSQMAATDNRLHAVESKLPVSFKQVAFTARFSADDGTNGVHLNPGQILQFDNVVTNIGNGYNSQTGIFTAPVGGTYVFSLTLMSTNGRGLIDVAITKQPGTILDRVWAEGSADAYDQGSGQVATHLAAGEEVCAKQVYGDSIRGDYWTIFTGYLVQAD